MTSLPHDNQIASNAFVRLIFMVLFFALFGVVRFMIWALVVFQFFAHLLTGGVNGRMQRWGEGLSAWTYAMLRFMTYNTERMPFPFHKLGGERE